MSGTKRVTNARIERIEAKLDAVDEAQDVEIERLDHIAECITVAAKNIGRLEEKLEEVNGRITRLHLRLDRVGSRVLNFGPALRILSVLLLVGIVPAVYNYIRGGDTDG